MKNTRISKLVKTILISGFFKEVLERAKKYASDKKNDNVSGLLTNVNEKKLQVSTNKSNFSFIEKIRTFSRLIKSYKSGEYKNFPLKSIVLIIAGLIYFLSPIDFIPDILPILGFSDDAAIVFWIFNSLESEIKKFLEWEQSKLQSISVY